MISARKIFLEKGRYPFWGYETILNLKKGDFLAVTNRPYSTFFVYKEIFLNNEHMNNRNFKKAETIVDIGANQGFYTIRMCKENKNLKVYCYEPNKETFRLLRKNISLNCLSDRVKLNNLGVWKENGKQVLISIPGNSSNATLESSASKSPWLKRKIARREIINTITLSEIHNSIPEKYIDILKIDTEGSEYDILSADLNVLKYYKKIVVEYHSKKLREQIINILTNNNFELVDETTDEKINVESGNIYFINKL
jgi:FkbM family methyltransferase